MMDIIEKLKDEGFKGFVRVEELMHNPKLPEDEKGVYVVIVPKSLHSCVVL